MRLLAYAALALSAACDSSPRETAGDPAAEKEDPVYVRAPDGRAWRRLEKDGLHDPANPVLPLLQQPAEALSVLPPGGSSGNQVDWMEALRSGAIAPRTNVLPETKVRRLDLDILFTETAGQPYVLFPHLQHTEWLDCENCHPKFFVAKRGANKFGMLEVLQGEYCGRCHGAVSFPLTECRRCHSQPWQ